MGHDQLFKRFFHEFLRDFLELFYPDVAARLNFTTLEFLDKELFTDFPEGSVREADVVARVTTHEGKPELILVHLEIQFRPEHDFPFRMFQYYGLLRFKYGVPVFPVAVYLQGGEGLAEEEYREALFGREFLRFRYQTVALARLEAEKYAGEGSPVAAALAALMDRKNAGDRLTLRLLMEQHVAKEKLGDAREYLLLDLIRTYFELEPDEEDSFHRLLLRPEYREVYEMELTWSEKMMEKWRLVGLIEGKRETLKHQLTKKFGTIPEKTMARIEALDSLEELDTYLDRVLTAESLEAMGLDGR
jgi:hypothetical protein